MPRRRKTALLPAELRRELDRRLIDGAFSGYGAMADWLAERGHAVGKSALHEYGQQLERRIEQVRLATEQAEALVAASPDDAGAVADASLRMVQQRIFDLMLAADEGALKDLAAAARALAETARAGTAVRAERRKALADAASAAGAEARKRGISAETEAAIRAAIQGAGQGQGA